MPTTRDYLIATIMGENNRGTVESQQGVLDTIINRQGNPTEYGARRGASVQDIVTARTPTGGYQYDAWRPELNGRPNGQFALSSSALQGRDALSGAAQRQYDQIARVVDGYLNDGVGRGITQGATFYQTPDAPNAWQRNSLWPRFGQITVGDHIYSGPNLVRDRAEFERRNPDLFTSQQAPAFQQDGFGTIFNPSQGYGAGESGSLGALTGLFETLPYGTSPNGGPGDALGGGPGSFGLDGAYPNQDVNPLAFGSAYNVGGGRPGAFTDFLPPVQTGDPFGFTGLDTGGGVGNGSFGNGIVQPGPAPDPFAFSGANMGGGVGPGSVGQLPAGFDGAAYLAANRDVAAAGVDPRQHYLSFGMQEGRALGPAGWTPTQGPSGSTSTLGPFDTASTLGNPFFAPTLGSGATTPTYGPDGSVSVTSQGLIPTGTAGFPDPTGAYPAPQTVNGLPPGFDARTYLAINPDVAASGIDAGTHYRLFGAQEGRNYGAPGLTATQGPPDLSSTFGPPGTASTLGPNGFASTIGPGGTVPSFSPGGDTSYLTMPSTTATTFGPPDASSALPAGFDAMSYVAANPDLKALSFTGQQAVDHFLNFGQHEARALAPGMEARVYAPPGATPTIGPGSLTPTFGAPDLTQTLGPPALTTTLGPPAATPTLGPTTTTPSWSPFGGAGIASPFGFSGFNPSQGLGAGPQSFGSLWPAGDSAATPQPAAGPDMSNPFGFTSADVSGFDVNAAPPMEGGGGQGGGGGSGTAKGSSSSAAFLADQARTRAYWESLVKPADLYGNTNTHTTPVITPVVPNLTVSNLALGAPGAMFSMFAPWR